MGAKRERGEILERVEEMIRSRCAWASSDEGRKVLGPGSPTVPGLQDLYAVRDFIHSRGEVKRKSK